VVWAYYRVVNAFEVTLNLLRRVERSCTVSNWQHFDSRLINWDSVLFSYSSFTIGHFRFQTLSRFLIYNEIWCKSRVLSSQSAVGISHFLLLHFSPFFRRVRKIAKSDLRLRHVRLSVWNNSAPTGRILIKLDIFYFFETLSKKFKFY
jgi:hypothetical protein